MSNSILYKLGFSRRFYLGTFLGLINFALAWITWSYFPANYQGATFTFVVFGATSPILIFRTIKCPKCHTQFMWNYFNSSQTLPKTFSPFTSTSCPECHYDPDDFPSSNFGA